MIRSPLPAPRNRLYHATQETFSRDGFTLRRLRTGHCRRRRCIGRGLFQRHWLEAWHFRSGPWGEFVQIIYAHQTPQLAPPNFVRRLFNIRNSAFPKQLVRSRKLLSKGAFFIFLCRDFDIGKKRWMFPVPRTRCDVRKTKLLER